MTNHTPGPWRTGAGNFGRILAGRIIVAETHTDDTFGEREELANARLIAAAPELLDAMRWVRTLIDNGYLRDPEWETLTLEQKADSKQQSIYDQISSLLSRIEEATP